VTDNEPPRELVGDFHVTDSRAGYWYVRCVCARPLGTCHRSRAEGPPRP